MHDEDKARLIDVGDSRLYVVERGDTDGYPVIVLHGGPGLDHHMFGDYLDALGDRYRLLLVDERAQGRSEPAPEDTWTIERMAADVVALAKALDLDRYAVELEDRMGEIRHPVLVLTGRHERTCVPEAAEAMADAIPGAVLVVFEHSAHMSFVEENEAYLAAVRDFLGQHAA